MSLINDMLRDLESRKNEGGDSTSAADIPIVVNTSARRNRKFLFAGLIVLLIGGTGFILQQDSGHLWPFPDNLPGDSQHTIEQVNDGELSIVRPLEPSEVSSPLLPLIVAETADSKDETIDVNNEAVMLSALSVSEEGATAQVTLDFIHMPDYRLVQRGDGTEPLVFSFSNARLGEDFDLPDIQKGEIESISLRPRKGRLELLVYVKSQMLVQGLQMIEMDHYGYQLMIDLERQKEKIELSSNVKSSLSPIVEAAAVAEPVSVVDTVEKVNKKEERAASDQQAFLRGMKELQRRKLDEAQAAFTQALKINPEFTDARMQLIDILLNKQQKDQAEKLFNEGMVVSADNISLRKQFARYLLQHQRSKETIGLLQRNPKPSMVDDLEYYALLAASFQESGQFEQAGELYGQLVTIRPQQAVWWMGFAISKDQSGHNEQAKMAYEKAVALPGLRPDLHNYIQGRLQVL